MSCSLRDDRGKTEGKRLCTEQILERDVMYNGGIRSMMPFLRWVTWGIKLSSFQLMKLCRICNPKNSCKNHVQEYFKIATRVHTGNLNTIAKMV
jgi:hypothetical protein